MIDPAMPGLFTIGDEIIDKRKIPPCPKFFGVIGYWPHGNYWSILSKWIDISACGEDRAMQLVEQFAKEKSAAGWIGVRIILFEGIREFDK